MWKMCPEKMKIFTKEISIDGPDATKVKYIIYFKYATYWFFFYAFDHECLARTKFSSRIFTANADVMI